MIFICGNGGSATQADHFAGELISDGIPCVALTNPAIITAIGNDYHFNEVFSRQICAMARPGDFVICLTTSGRSENVRLAILAAKMKNCECLVITGEDADIPYAPETIIRLPGDTQEIQEHTLRVLHALWKGIAADVR